MCQKFIFKIHSTRLKKSKWKLTLPLDEARRNDEVISIADSQILRWIDELNGIEDADTKAKEIKLQIKNLRSRPFNAGSKREIRELYAELDRIQFKPDYLFLIIDKKSDYYAACNGFSINGIRYVRLLGTNGGIKNSTIVFVSERLAPELRRRIENGRDPGMELVTAKLEAYKALVCSASNPVSMPHGIAVVDDAETQFLSDIFYLTDDVDGEPVLERRDNEQITIDATDGFGIMLPSLAERWSREIGLGYDACAFNTRFAFEKGMLVTFDFLDFADKVAKSYMIKDAWGNMVDVREVEVILTTSMVKLYDSYASCDDYVRNSLENGYTFGVSKVAPEELENERNLNYQFIQSYDLSDEDVDELIRPTIEEIEDVLHGDWRKTLVFLKGKHLNASNVDSIPNDFAKAIMVDRRVMDDPFVQNSIYQLIHKRINDAKVGVVKVHGNYSIICGDPYLLCQSIFGMNKTGLLYANEIYNKYWADYGSEDLVCFRAPMTCYNNIRKVHPVRREDASYWYRYLHTVTVFNAWDTTTAALNGCDFDGDIVMLTDNSVLLRNHNPTPALMCIQRKAKKRISSEGDFIQSNIDSFGNDIGTTTNWITSMYEVRSRYKPDSEEYEALSYRICCGQLFQQNAIDKAKGIVCRPMPRNWHDRHAVHGIEDPDVRAFYNRIVADKKPYFMRYIYPELMKQYNTYIKNTNKNCMREFQISIDELKAIPEAELTERQIEFLTYYDRRFPVGVGDCVMNRICRRFEERFDGCLSRVRPNLKFDYRFMRGRAKYSKRQYYAIEKAYNEYNRHVVNYKSFAKYEHIDKEDLTISLMSLNSTFYRECSLICHSEAVMGNIVLDICYSRNRTKKFAWTVCGKEIIQNLLANHGNTISFPVMDHDGEFEYGGDRFTIETKEVGI